ncbi:MAG: CTP synthase [bacterium]
MSKFIFVTGGVVSGLGKGITTASIGLLLKNSGFEVDAIKFDPYLNIDPGTMSPFEHGEVYVLDDGSETDLDLGHYERYLNTNLSKYSSVTSGKIYDGILSKEREGAYLGKNVQIIPHVTNAIKEAFTKEAGKDYTNHIRLIEIGGSTGDLEGEIYLESLRQFKQQNRGDVLHIHLGYVPYLDCSGEYKTKPMQTSIRELNTAGLQPDIVVARYYPEDGQHLSKEALAKIALFSNTPENAVTPIPDLSSIYAVPKHLIDSNMIANLEEFVGKKINIQLSKFFEASGEVLNPTKTVKIGIVGKYASRLSDADYSLQQSLKIAGFHAGVKVEVELLNAEKIHRTEAEEAAEWKRLKACQAIIIPGGFGIRGLEGKVVAAKYARENKIPFLGICLGLQMAVVEFARDVAGLNAYSSEMLEESTDEQKKDKDFVIDFIDEQKAIHTKGGTMRLGGYDCWLEKDSLAFELFGTEKIRERHRHRLEVQGKFLALLESKGLIVSGKHKYTGKDGQPAFLVELIELSRKDHPYFIATQSHPEFLSRPDKPQPLFFGLVEAASKL